MRHLFVKHTMCAAAAACFLFSFSASKAASVVMPGFDLFTTDHTGTIFAGQNFQGVALGTFDFGGITGIQPVGGTDTIVQRTSAAVGPGTDTIDIELVALQLRSVVKFDFGLGVDFYFVTLQTGTPSLGTMDITFAPEGDPHGTFVSELDVRFDVRKGSLTNPIIFSDNFNLTSAPSPWSHQALPTAPQIPLVNLNLNGVNNQNDFWGVPIHTGPHRLPEPSRAILSLLGLGVVLVRRRR